MYKILSEKLRPRRILFTVVRNNYIFNKKKQNCIYNKTFLIKKIIDKRLP